MAGRKAGRGPANHRPRSRGARESPSSSLSEYNLFDYMPNWVQPLVGTKEERIAKLSEEGVRVGMKRDVIERPHPRTDWTQGAGDRSRPRA